LTGDELDGPRGRIYLIKDMLESGARPNDEVVERIDRCLSCLACMTTCPSSVDYMHLVDYARSEIEQRGSGSATRRSWRTVLAWLLSSPRLIGSLLPLARLVPAALIPSRFRHFRALLNGARSSGGALQSHYPATPPRRGSVALLPGCVQQSLDNEINHASVRLLNRIGYDVEVLTQSACCGAIRHHLGEHDATLRQVRGNIAEWNRRLRKPDCEALLVNASGCGTMIKDYGHLLAHTPEHETAARLSAAARDISEFLLEKLAHLPPSVANGRVVAFQNPCSMEHGQRLRDLSPRLLRHCGYEVRELPANSGCCGSAGTYNLLQPDFARQLGERKAAQLKATGATVIASGNIGCILQLRQYGDVPVMHTVQLLDAAG
jgi:glycolate oxidase iron-sulfur subunit